MTYSQPYRVADQIACGCGSREFTMDTLGVIYCAKCKGNIHPIHAVVFASFGDIPRQRTLPVQEPGIVH